MRGELKLIFVFPPFHSCLRLPYRAERCCTYGLRGPSVTPHLSLCSSERLSFLLVRSHVSLSAFDPITPICTVLRAGCLFPVFFWPSPFLSPSVSPLYIYMRVLGHTVAFIHVCVLRCIIVLSVFLVPFFLASQCVFLSRFSFSIPPIIGLQPLINLMPLAQLYRTFRLCFWFARGQGMTFAFAASVHLSHAHSRSIASQMAAYEANIGIS